MLERQLTAAKNADWEQVRQNGGPPCFHLEDEGKFCLRAQRWAGHPSDNQFTTLHDALLEAKNA